MTKAKRIILALNLCLVFTFLAWKVSEPFIEGYFQRQMETSLLQTLIGANGQNLKLLKNLDSEQVETLQANHSLFSELPLYKQEAIQQRLEFLHTDGPLSLSEKFSLAFHNITQGTSSYLQAWMLISTVVSFLFLFQIDGAKQLTFLLPLIAIAFSISTLFYPIMGKVPADYQLFPSEESLLSHYNDKALSADISLQQEELRDAWKYFIITEWTKETPSHDTTLLNEQFTRGQYIFNLARANRLEHPADYVMTVPHNSSLALLLIFFLWNLFIAWFLQRGKTELSTLHPTI